MLLDISERIGISTHFLQATHGEDLYTAIQMVADAGFKGFELVPSRDQAQIGYPYNIPNVGIDLFEASDAELARLKGALGRFSWMTLHSPHIDWNIASVNRHLRKLTWQFYERCLDVASELGAAAMTYHLGGQSHGYIRAQSEINDFNLAFATQIMPKAKKYNIAVGYEAGGLAELKYVADQLPGWGINLDIGHAYMYAGDDAGFFLYIDEFIDRIIEVHHNGVNHYWNHYMEHQPPHMNNMIDFQRVYTRLRKINYTGPIVCEIQGNDIEQVIQHCLESKEMICRIWNGDVVLKERWNRS